MKKLLIGTVAAVALTMADSANAADVPVSPAYKAVPLAEPTYNWTGLYFGGHVGGDWASSRWTYTNINPYDSPGPGGPITGSINDFRMSSWVGGVQLGFNYQFDRLLAGVEASWSGTNLSQTNPNVVQVFAGSIQSVQTQITQLATVTGRLGVLFDPAWLVYVKGGYATALIGTTGSTTPAVAGLNLNWTTAQWHDGWVVGGGVEHRLWKNATLGVEYNYIRLNTATHTGGVSGGAITAANQIVHDVDANIHTVVARVNFLFNWTPAVIARY